MVFRTNRRRKSSVKRRYTKRRGGSHKRKVYRNKHRRKSYHMKRGGGFGTKAQCYKQCQTINDDKRHANCLKSCDNAFKPENIQKYDEKLDNTAGDDYKTNFMDAEYFQGTPPPAAAVGTLPPAAAVGTADDDDVYV